MISQLRQHSPQVPESVLSRIWEEQRFHSHRLKTTAGLDVQVIRRGRKNRDNGPDFRNALIRIGDRVYEGDVELHLEVAGWHTHGHERDPNYNHTILHVVLWPPRAAKDNALRHQIRRADGQSVPTILVLSCLSATLDTLVDRFQRADRCKQQKTLQCQKELKAVSPEQTLSILQQLGTERLDERVRRFEAWLPTIHSPMYSTPRLSSETPGVCCPSVRVSPTTHPVSRKTTGVSLVTPPGRRVSSKIDEPKILFQQLLYEAICEGLGYSSNKRPFVELARRLPLDLILSHLPTDSCLDGDVGRNSQRSALHWIQAILFGTAGLLDSLQEEPPKAQNGLCQITDPETSEYLSELRSFWDMLSSCLDIRQMRREDWHFFRLRPPNFPTRRLAALSYLLFNYSMQPLFDSYLRLFTLFSGHPQQTTRSIRLLERTLEIPAAGYWKGRYLFGKPVFAAHDRMFLGQSRIRDIIISAVFPVLLLYARQTSQAQLESQILSLYNIFPAPSRNRVTKTIQAQLFAHRKEPLPNIHRAIIYQGMLQLYKHYCYLPACGHCPLAKEDFLT